MIGQCVQSRAGPAEVSWPGLDERVKFVVDQLHRRVILRQWRGSSCILQTSGNLIVPSLSAGKHANDGDDSGAEHLEFVSKKGTGPRVAQLCVINNLSM